MAKSKRRNKKTAPNIPQSTLDRARRQLNGEDDLSASEETGSESELANEVEKSESRTNSPVERRTASRRSTRRRSGNPDVMQFGRREKRKKDGSMDSSAMEQMLANPTIFVTEEELRSEYGFVLADLRNMGILAAGLMVLLIGLAQFI